MHPGVVRMRRQAGDCVRGTEMIPGIKRLRREFIYLALATQPAVRAGPRQDGGGRRRAVLPGLPSCQLRPSQTAFTVAMPCSSPTVAPVDALATDGWANDVDACPGGNSKIVQGTHVS